jgi:hypothetical protein
MHKKEPFVFILYVVVGHKLNHVLWSLSFFSFMMPKLCIDAFILDLTDVLHNMPTRQPLLFLHLILISEYTFPYKKYSIIIMYL